MVTGFLISPSHMFLKYIYAKENLSLETTNVGLPLNAGGYIRKVVLCNVKIDTIHVHRISMADVQTQSTSYIANAFGWPILIGNLSRWYPRRGFTP